jgi:hypothetical protein
MNFWHLLSKYFSKIYILYKILALSFCVEAKLCSEPKIYPSVKVYVH